MSLFLSSKNLCGQTNINSPSTGNVQRDTIILDLNDIKGLTIKLLEREKYIKLNAQKDTLIRDYKNVISVQENNIEALNGEISNYRSEIKDYETKTSVLEKQVKKQKRNIKIVGGVGTLSTLLAIIIPILL